MGKKTLERQFLGKILMDHKVIDQKQMKRALEVQKENGGFLGQVLIDLGYVQEHDIVAALVVQCHVPYIAVDRYEIDENVIRMIPADVARKYRVVPLDRVNDVLSIVMADPLDMDVKAELQSITNCQLAPFIGTTSEIATAISRWYDGILPKPQF